MSTHKFLAAALAATAGLSTTAIATVAAATVPPADTIPDGLYERVATLADGEALGLDDALLDELLGTDGELSIAFEIAGDRWTHYVTNDAGIREAGDGGTAGYDADRRWVAVNDGGVVITYDWTYEDGTLTLAPDETVTTPGGERQIGPDELLVTGGVYERGDAAATEEAAAITLRFAGPLVDMHSELVEFIVEVQRLSGGTIEFEWLPAYGSTLLTDLADSTVDIGWLGTAWGGDFYLPEFDALAAPLLVDSHDLQQAVFDAGIPQRMLAELDLPGVVGIAVVPGPLRRVMGVDHPFTSPDAFAGAVVANDATPVAEATMTALGATSTPGAEGLSLDELDAVVAHFGAITGNGYHTQADSVVANLNLWPRPLAIVMSAESFDALSPEHQHALMTAGTNVFEAAMESSRDEDSGPGAELCAAPIQVIETSESDLAEIEAALEPVYADLESDPETAAYLDQIRAIKDELGAPPDTLVCAEE